ncbi:MAG: nucleotidyltransferase domain-containing protein [Thermoproteota archaeon]|nr:MAG: nucleotidyltransferase domain-containing protein [Candidatus Korarchaeota archaeon]
MSDLEEPLVEFARRTLESLRNWRSVAAAVKEAVLRRCPDARIYVFGSVVEGRITAASDLDVLVVCDLKREEAIRLKVGVLRGVGRDVPGEIDVVDRKGLSLYERFANLVEV